MLKFYVVNNTQGKNAGNLYVSIAKTISGHLSSRLMGGDISNIAFVLYPSTEHVVV